MKHTHKLSDQVAKINTGKSFTVANETQRQSVLRRVKLLNEAGVLKRKVSTRIIAKGKPEFEVFVSSK